MPSRSAVVNVPLRILGGGCALNKKIHCYHQEMMSRVSSALEFGIACQHRQQSVEKTAEFFGLHELLTWLP
jgi:hypothetical protein